MITTKKTVRHVRLCLAIGSDDGLRIQVDDSTAPEFIVPEKYIVESEWCCDWSAEIELFDGLIEYLKAYDIFEYIEDEGGFHRGDLIEDRTCRWFVVRPCPSIEELTRAMADPAVIAVLHSIFERRSPLPSCSA